jgi:hypothetical protein
MYYTRMLLYLLHQLILMMGRCIPNICANICKTKDNNYNIIETNWNIPDIKCMQNRSKMLEMEE